MDIKALSDLIYTKRAEKRLTRLALSEMTGVSTKTISGIENAQNARITLEVIGKLAKVLGLNLGDFDAILRDKANES